MYHLIVSLTTKLPRPLNSIGMPYYDTLLLSSWTSKFLSTSIVAPPPPKIPSQILSTMKFNDNVAYASLPKELRGRRNVVQSVPRKSTGRFRSGRRKIEVYHQNSVLPISLKFVISSTLTRRRMNTSRTRYRSYIAR